MNRKAWAAMNDALMKHRPVVNVQIISNDIVEALHGAGFVIVPHVLNNQMLEDSGAMSDDLDGFGDADHRAWWSSVLFGPIKNRQESEQ